MKYVTVFRPYLVNIGFNYQTNFVVYQSNFYSLHLQNSFVYYLNLTFELPLPNNQMTEHTFHAAWQQVHSVYQIT